MRLSLHIWLEKAGFELEYNKRMFSLDFGVLWEALGSFVNNAFLDAKS